jgi:hypothetical protein
VKVVADLPADMQPTEPVQQRQRLFHDPAVGPQAQAMFGAAPGDDRSDALVPDLGAVLVVVITAVGEDAIWAPAGSAEAAAYWRDGFE